MRHSWVLNTILIGLISVSTLESNAHGRKVIRKKNSDYETIINTSPSNPWPKIQKPKVGPAQIIGFYTGGCISGAQSLPLSGPHYEVMRPSRNRYYGHSQLLALIDRIGAQADSKILVGDMAQPRGGPAPFGHASHQLGIESDIWIQPLRFFTASPITMEQRESFQMTSVVEDDWKTFKKSNWSEDIEKVIFRAASDPLVDRIFVNAVIKKYLCKKSPQFSFLNKIRPWYFHNSHFHVRMKCPAGMEKCRNQAPVPSDDGCGKDLDFWFSKSAIAVQAGANEDPVSRAVKMPKACRAFLQ